MDFGQEICKDVRNDLRQQVSRGPAGPSETGDVEGALLVLFFGQLIVVRAEGTFEALDRFIRCSDPRPLAFNIHV